MQLAVLTSSISRQAGGLYESVRYLHRTIADDIPTTVISLIDDYTNVDISVWHPLNVLTYPVLGPRSLGYSPAMYLTLARQKPDLVHVHGLWQGPSIASIRYHALKRRPHVISPRGMLDKWALQNSMWKKRLACSLFEYRHLNYSACIHALCQSELDSIRAFGLTNPIALIPNGVALPLESDLGNGKLKSFGKSKVLLFMGRLHPKKGLINALKAWAKLQKNSTQYKSWRWVIAGWDQGNHVATLKQLCRELEISEVSLSVTDFLLTQQIDNHDMLTSVVFVGSAYKEDKDALFRCASAFMLPSFSEGLPMSVLEAWSYRLPVLMTDHCNLPEGFYENAAIRISTNVDSIVEGLLSLMLATDLEINSMGCNGRALVEQRFTWDQVAKQMKDVYGWLQSGGSTPDCIH